jgi:hypothetical protein
MPQSLAVQSRLLHHGNLVAPGLQVTRLYSLQGSRRVIYLEELVVAQALRLFHLFRHKRDLVAELVWPLADRLRLLSKRSSNQAQDYLTLALAQYQIVNVHRGRLIQLHHVDG